MCVGLVHVEGIAVANWRTEAARLHTGVVAIEHTSGRHEEREFVVQFVDMWKPRVRRKWRWLSTTEVVFP